MILKELILALDRAGLQLRVDGENLKVLGRAESLSPDLRAAIVALKPELLSLISARPDVELGALAPVPKPLARHDPFPLTDIQQAYWFGRQSFVPLGGVSTYYYGEFDCPDLDPSRLEESLNELILRHDMLRAVIREDGLQQVLATTPPYAIRSEDLRNLSGPEQAARLTELRDQMSHQVRPLNVWPLFEVRVSRLGGDLTRLHLGIDLLIADFLSLANLASEWRGRYDRPGKSATPADLSFRDCVLALTKAETSPKWARAKAYWDQRLEDLPPAPMLPTLAASSPDRRFTRLEAMLPREAWKRIETRARALGVSSSSVLLTAFAQVLSTWSGDQVFTLTLTQFGRSANHPQIASVVGDFTTSVLTAVNLGHARSFAERIQAVHRRVLADLDHADYSGVRVARDLVSRTGDPSRAAFPVVFTSALALKTPGDDLVGFEVFGREVFGISQTPQVALDHVVGERGGVLHFRWDHRAALFPPGMVADMFEAYQTLLATLSDPARDWSEDLRARPTQADLAERAMANATAQVLPGGRLESLFAARAHAHPEATAVVSSTATVTYGELLRRAQAVAMALQDAEIEAGALIAVHVAASVDQVAAVLGVLFAGCAYVPLSPSWPAARRRDVMKRAGVLALVTSTGCRDHEADGLPLVFADAVDPARTGWRAPIQDDAALAYVIFTSGSTGRPKGVAMTHRAAVNTLQDLNGRYGVTEADRVLAVSDLAFDLSVYDIFGVLGAGGALVTLVEEGHGRRNPRHWRELVETHGVTIWNSVPALMEMMVEHVESSGGDPLRGLRLVMLSGDWIPVSLPDRLRRLAPTAAIYGLGGATEAAIWSIHHPILGPVTTSSVPYGKPLANQRWHVLGKDLESCPRHVPGELYIAGEGLALGYWADPELTAASFVTHPQTGERLYRTGDFGRYGDAGIIEFLGRKDGQVKLGGFRIELEEIEAKLQDHPAVAAAAAVVVGGRELAVAVVVRPGTAPPNADAIRAWLSERLPRYMVPHRIALLGELPKTGNGKIDRSAVAQRMIDLPVGEDDSPAPPAIAELEARILALLALETNEPLSATANFFEQGVNSVMLVKLHGQIEVLLERAVDPVVMFDFPSPRMLAVKLADQAAAVDDSAQPPAATDLRMLRAARGARRRMAASDELG